MVVAAAPMMGIESLQQRNQAQVREVTAILPAAWVNPAEGVVVEVVVIPMGEQVLVAAVS